MYRIGSHGMRAEQKQGRLQSQQDEREWCQSDRQDGGVGGTAGDAAAR